MAKGALYEQLKNCSSEEDVKDAYIKALGLTGVRKNLVDIQTDEIWFEAKNGSKVSSYEMFTQLLHYEALDFKQRENSIGSANLYFTFSY